ncbi:hypothetical protein LZ32DRAFT_690739, partial [Colletotrichum eremochloae]
ATISCDRHCYCSTISQPNLRCHGPSVPKRQLHHHISAGLCWPSPQLHVHYTPFGLSQWPKTLRAEQSRHQLP